MCSLHTQVVTNWGSTSTKSLEERGFSRKSKMKTDGRSWVDCKQKQPLPTSFFCSTTHCGPEYKTLGTPIYGGGGFTRRVTIDIEILNLVGKTGDI